MYTLGKNIPVYMWSLGGWVTLLISPSCVVIRELFNIYYIGRPEHVKTTTSKHFRSWCNGKG